MTEKIDFENLSAFNSAEGRIFYPLAVESGDFPQLRSRFFKRSRCWKLCSQVLWTRSLQFVSNLFWIYASVSCIIKLHAKRFKIKASEEFLDTLSMPYPKTQPWVLGKWNSHTQVSRCLTTLQVLEAGESRWRIFAWWRQFEYSFLLLKTLFL